MAIDWLNATRAQRKILYRALKREADRRNQSALSLWSDIIDVNAATDYDKTLRAGTYSRKTAAQLHLWFERHAPDQALRVNEELRSGGTLLPGQLWQDLIDTHATEDGLRVLPRSKSGLEIVGLASQAPPTHVRLNEEFFLRLDCPRAGVLGAVQAFDSVWYPLPLASEQSVIAVEQGELHLPRCPESGGIEHLSEPSDIGLHHFVLILSGSRDAFGDLPSAELSHSLSPSRLDQLAVEIQNTVESILLWRVRFTVLPS